jgi:hypothetical protein
MNRRRARASSRRGAIALGIALGSFCADALASNRVNALGVGAYAACSSSDIFGARDSASSFYSSIHQITGFSGGTYRADGTVNYLYMIDPEWSGNASGLDGNADNGFDKYNVAMAWFGGHGSCGADGRQGANNPSVGCVAPSNCHAGPWYALSNTGYCTSPPPAVGWGPRCAYPYQHGVYTCSGGVSKFVEFSQGGTPNIRMGESSVVGGWAGAGTNGGANVLFINASCPSHIGSLLRDTAQPFAGIALFATNWVVSGDVSMTSQYGSVFGSQAVSANGNINLANLWLNITALITEGGGCPQGGGYAKGGINGCGGNVIVARDYDGERTGNKFAMTVTNTQTESWDSYGDGYWAYEKSCNYDCSTYPPMR